MNQEIKPYFLISMPQLQDTFFTQSVVLILSHDQNGAMGLLLNRPTQTHYLEFSKENQLSCHEKHERKLIYFGGPVEVERGWVLHENKELSEKTLVSEELFLSTSKESLNDLLKDPTQNFKLYLGYSGWTAGQLEREISEGSWISCPFRFEVWKNFETEWLWRKIILDMGIDPSQLVATHGMH